MSEEIKPVLTAEEWARGYIDLADEGSGIGYAASGALKPGGVEIGANFDAVLGPKDCARLASFLLQRAGPDGGPLFTWADVGALREEYESEWAGVSKPNGGDALLSIADRLASLLLPRDRDVLAVLVAIDRGEIPVRKTDLGTLVDYETVDGWRFRIFDDAGEWDYVDAFARPGEDWTPCNPDSHREIFDWTPSDATLGTVWRWFGTIKGEP